MFNHQQAWIDSTLKKAVCFHSKPTTGWLEINNSAAHLRAVNLDDWIITTMVGMSLKLKAASTTPQLIVESWENKDAPWVEHGHGFQPDTFYVSQLDTCPVTVIFVCF